MNKAVTIHLFLIKDEHMTDEGFKEPKHLFKSMDFHQSLQKNLKSNVDKRYKRLFGGTIREHMLDEIDDDELFAPETQFIT